MTFSPSLPASFGFSSPFLKTRIHPRTKEQLGRRIARGVLETAYGDARFGAAGPVLESCSANASAITIYFNRTRLSGDSIAVWAAPSVFQDALIQAFWGCIRLDGGEAKLSRDGPCGSLGETPLSELEVECVGGWRGE